MRSSFGFWTNSTLPEQHCFTPALTESQLASHTTSLDDILSAFETPELDTSMM
jgi:hypothetical protein